MATVSPMDKHVYFTLDAGNPSCMTAIENAEYITLEINENMPRVLGGNQEIVYISVVDYVFESRN
ncbi:MAG TPA: hypothetical protein VFC73_04905 [Syntrophomonadaceae bacterium]|nr:hypothetical protein [Syntrophomonadaceae bacterium]